MFRGKGIRGLLWMNTAMAARAVCIMGARGTSQMALSQHPDTKVPMTDRVGPTMKLNRQFAAYPADGGCSGMARSALTTRTMVVTASAAAACCGCCRWHWW